MIRYIGVGFRRAQSNLRIAVYDGSNALKMRFEYAAGRMPVAMTKGGQRYYLAYDQVGSLRVVTDASGNAVKRIEYDSFGNIISDSNPSLEIPFGFAGGLHDRDTGLVRFGYRDYDPDTGRWTAKDPILFAGGDTNLYGYCLSDPVNGVDPFGLEFSSHNTTPYDIDYGGGSGSFAPPAQSYNPNHNMMNQTVDYGKDYAGGIKDFVSNYKDMRDENTIGADKYFHCMANCQAARRGSGGRDASIDISETREWVDENIKGDPASACNADRAANNQGRDSNPNQSCKSACSSLRPPYLSEKY